MHLAVLAVPGCPNAALLEEQLASVLEGRPGVTVSRRSCEVPGRESAPPGERDVDECDQDGYLDERADDAGQGLAADITKR